jgi:disulfide oxidoreductase YuzD
LTRRFGDDAVVAYRNVDDEDVRSEFDTIVTEIQTRGLLYPVTVVDGAPLYDGAVSYPAIMRAVTNKLAEREAAQA